MQLRLSILKVSRRRRSFRDRRFGEWQRRCPSDISPLLPLTHPAVRLEINDEAWHWFWKLENRFEKYLIFLLCVWNSPSCVFNLYFKLK